MKLRFKHIVRILIVFLLSINLLHSSVQADYKYSYLSFINPDGEEISYGIFEGNVVIIEYIDFLNCEDYCLDQIKEISKVYEHFLPATLFLWGHVDYITWSIFVDDFEVTEVENYAYLGLDPSFSFLSTIMENTTISFYPYLAILDQSGNIISRYDSQVVPFEVLIADISSYLVDEDTTTTSSSATTTTISTSTDAPLRTTPTFEPSTVFHPTTTSSVESSQETTTKGSSSPKSGFQRLISNPLFLSFSVLVGVLVIFSRMNKS